jgi:hypothetical protein
VGRSVFLNLGEAVWEDECLLRESGLASSFLHSSAAVVSYNFQTFHLPNRFGTQEVLPLKVVSYRFQRQW